MASPSAGPGGDTFLEPKYPSDGLAVADPSRPDELHHLRQRDQGVLDALVGFRLSRAWFKPARQVYGHGLLQKAWTGIKEQRPLPALCGVASFFQQFALAGGEWVLAGIDAAGRQLEQVVLCGITV